MAKTRDAARHEYLKKEALFYQVTNALLRTDFVESLSEVMLLGIPGIGEKALKYIKSGEYGERMKKRPFYGDGWVFKPNRDKKRR